MNINDWLELEELRERQAMSRDERLMQFYAPRQAPTPEVVTAPRGWSQTTDDALAAAGYGPDQGFSPLTGAFEGDPDDPMATASIQRMIEEGAARLERETEPEPRPTRASRSVGMEMPSRPEEQQGRADARQFFQAADESTQSVFNPYESAVDRYDPQGDPTATAQASMTPTGASTMESTEPGRDSFWRQALGSSRLTGVQPVDRMIQNLGTPTPGPAEDERPEWQQTLRGAETSVANVLRNIPGADGLRSTQQRESELQIGEAFRALTDADERFQELDEGMQEQLAERERVAGPFPTLEDTIVSEDADGERVYADVSDEYLQSLLDVQGRVDNLERARQDAIDLGLDPDAGPGLLVRGLDLMARPMRAGIGASTGLAGARLGSFEEGEGGWEEALARGRSQWEGDTDYDWFDHNWFEITDEHTWWEKTGRGLTGFIANVATDPLTYLTFGSAGLARRSVGELAERSATTAANRAGFQRLSRDIGEEGQERLLRNMGDDGVFAHAVAKRADEIRAAGAAGTGRGTFRATDPADVLSAAESQGRLGVVRALDAQDAGGLTEALLRDGLENMAGAARLRFGATGLRRDLSGVFGNDSVFQALPREVRGGVQMTVPFASRQTEFGRGTYSLQLTPGGGGAMAPLSDAVNSVRSAMAASPSGRAWQHIFAGRDREAVKAMTQALRSPSSEGVAGQAYQQYRTLRDAGLITGEWSARRATQSHAFASSMGRHLDMGDEALNEQAQRAMRAHWNARGSTTYDLERALEGIDPAAVAAGRHAEQLGHELMQDAFNELSQHMPLGMVRNYTPRRLASEIQEQFQLTRGRSVGRKGGKAQPTKRRTGEFVNLEIDGRGNVAIRSWMSPDEVADEAALRGSRVQFEQNPVEVLADYMDAMTNLTRRNVFLDHLETNNLIQRPQAIRPERVSDAALGDAIQPATQAAYAGRRGGETLRRAVQNEEFDRTDAIFGEMREILGDQRVAQILDEVPEANVVRVEGRYAVEIGDETWDFADLDSALKYADRVTLTELYDRTSEQVIDMALSDTETLRGAVNLRNAPLESPEAFEAWIESTADVVGRWANTSPQQFRQAIMRPEDVATGYRRRLLQDLDWQNVPEEAKDAVAARALSESGALTPESVAGTLREHYRMTAQTEETLRFFDKVWQPYYTTFKGLATTGRGPGFAIRNAGGGMWNAMLSGTRASHFSTASRMMQAEHRGRRKAMEQIAGMDRVTSPQETVDLVRESIRSEFGRSFKKRGDRLFDALEAFYARNLMSGTRTDDIMQQSALSTSMAANRMAGGPRTASILGDGLGPGEENVAMRALRAPGRAMDRMRGAEAVDATAGTRGQRVDAMEPGMQRLMGFDQTVFTGVPRSELNRVQRVVQAASDNPWVRSMSSLAEVSERYTRLAPFLKGLDDFGLDDGGRAAGLLVKAGQFDYGDLSLAERKVLRNLMPFYTFTRNNVPFQVRGWMSSPDQIAKLGHAWGAVEEVTGDDRWSANLLPRWVRDNLGFATNVSPRDIDDATGNLLSQVPGLSRMFDSEHPIAVNLSTLPVTDLEKVLGPSLRDEAVSMLNPLVKLPIEEGLGVDTFTRGALRPDEGAPNFMQGEAWADFVDAAPGLHRSPGTGEARVDRRLARGIRETIPTANQLERALGSSDRYADRQLTSVASMLLGAPVSTLDPIQIQSEARRGESRIRDDISQVLGWGITPGQVRDAVVLYGPGQVQEALREPGTLQEMIEQMEAADDD